MSQKIVVNGIEYPSPDAMPPEVRRQYERALLMMQDVVKGAVPGGKGEKTVETTRDGVSIKVHTKQVKYTVDGKTYDDPSQLPPEIRAQLERALDGTSKLELGDPGPSDVRVMDVHTEVVRGGGVPRFVWWLLIAAAMAVVAVSLL